MSLRAFHKLFITAAVFITAMFAVWVFFFAPKEAAGIGLTITGCASVATSLGLVIYGVTFLKKTRHLEA